MIRPLRSSLLGIAVLLCGAAFAQPVPPFNVTVAGFVLGCSPASTVNIITVQGTQPALDIDVPLDANCGFTIDLSMDSYNGWFQFSTPCNGAIVTAIGSYTITTTDSAYVFVTLDCNSGSGCNACMDMVSNSPFTATFNSCTTGGASPYTNIWDFSDAGAEPGDAVTHVYPGPGTYTVCLNVTDASGNGCNTCEQVYVDGNGNVTFDPPAPCNACFSTAQSNTPGGGELPFTAVLEDCSTGGQQPYAYAWSFDGGSTFSAGPADTAYTFSEGVHIVCLQLLTADGQSCSTCDSVVVDANGTINPTTNPDPCMAGFWAIQAYEIDSMNPNGSGTPIPYEIWVWNLSEGGTGFYTFNWNFGDGTSSTEAYPTHIYPGSGPYLLCLSITDSDGCTDTYCDSIAVDANGIYQGIAPGGGDDRAALTLNVIDPLITAVAGTNDLGDLNVWPNPVQGELNITLSSTLHGTVDLMVIDASGRTVSTARRAVNSGNNRMELSTGDLKAGMYLLRITNGKEHLTHRFVRTY